VQLQLIRGATLRLCYGGHWLLVDPCLAAKHALPSFAGRSPNPLGDLPCSPDEVLAGIEATLISHWHSDHFDPAAQALLPREMPLLCQPRDVAALRAQGFRRVTPLRGTVTWRGMAITRTAGQHGSGAVLAEMGPVSGFVLRAEGEPTVYWAGDTVWCGAVARVLAEAQPAVVITHSSGAVWGPGTLIVMDAAQTVAVCEAAPQAIVVATHMDSFDHGTVSRQSLRAYASAHGIAPDRLLIPADGERLSF